VMHRYPVLYMPAGGVPDLGVAVHLMDPCSPITVSELELAPINITKSSLCSSLCSLATEW
jgi:hypothetical protein